MNTTTAEKPQKTASEASSYTVDALVDKLSLTANTKIWQKIDGLVCVQGTAGKVKSYGKVVYFDLKGSNAGVSVKCPSELAPQEGERIMVEGLVIFQPARFQTGLQLLIDGKPIATWEPRSAYEASAQINLNKSSYHRLNDYIQHQSLENFCILGTETAIRDVLSQVQSDLKEDLWTQAIVVSNKKTMLAELEQAIEGCDGFAIVRGGDDQSLEIWNDPEVVRVLLDYKVPFYVALGHTHCMTLTTQYADEGFHTPSAMGKAIHDIVQQIIDRIAKDKELDTLKANQVRLEKDRDIFLYKQKAFRKKQNLYFTISTVLGIIAAVLALIVFM